MKFWGNKLIHTNSRYFKRDTEVVVFTPMDTGEFATNTLLAMLPSGSSVTYQVDQNKPSEKNLIISISGFEPIIVTWLEVFVINKVTR